MDYKANKRLSDIIWLYGAYKEYYPHTRESLDTIEEAWEKVSREYGVDWVAIPKWSKRFVVGKLAWALDGGKIVNDQDWIMPVKSKQPSEKSLQKARDALEMLYIYKKYYLDTPSVEQIIKSWEEISNESLMGWIDYRVMKEKVVAELLHERINGVVWLETIPQLLNLTYDNAPTYKIFEQVESHLTSTDCMNLTFEYGNYTITLSKECVNDKNKF